ncbi:MAG: hypothetical protein NTNFB02_18210 [Nitrospira sp.]
MPLLAKLYERIVAEGTSYPRDQLLQEEEFQDYWVRGKYTVVAYERPRKPSSEGLGAFYLKPNWPGRLLGAVMGHQLPFREEFDAVFRKAARTCPPALPRRQADRWMMHDSHPCGHEISITTLPRPSFARQSFFGLPGWGVRQLVGVCHGAFSINELA